MTRNFTRCVFLFLILCLPGLSTELFAQCANNNTYYMDVTTSTNGQTTTAPCIYGGEYVTATVCTGVTYVISTCASATFDTQITLYSSTGTYLGYDDDGCGISGGASTISWTATFDGSIRILVDQYNCTSNNTCVTLTVQQIGSCSTGADGCPDNNNLYSVNATPSGVGNTVTISDMYAGEYVNVSVCQGASYTFASCGATYDTQLTLYSSTGTLLAHNDDGCGFQSSITWTASFTGTVRLLLDAYINSTTPCGSNSTNTPVTITQNTACANTCTFNSVTATNGGCDGSDNLINFVTNYSGSCTVVGIWVMAAGGSWEYLAFTTPFTSGQTIALYFANSNTSHSYYFQLSNGTFSSTYTLTTINCTNGPCPNDNAFFNANATPTQVGVPVTITNMYAGEYLNVNVCQGASYTFSTCSATYDTKLALYTPTGTLLAENDDFCGLQSSITWTATFTGVVRILLDQYTAENPCATNSINTPISITQNTACPSSCVINSVTHQSQGCQGTSNLVNFTVNFTGACTVVSMWVNTGTGWQEVALNGTFASGQTIGMLLNLSNTTYQYYFELSNGALSNTYSYTTINCNQPSCSNLSISYVNTGCQLIDGEQQPTGNITPTFTGACTVAGIYSSVNGGPFEYLDLTAYNIVSGFPVGLVFPYQGSNYVVYYVLNNGTTSPTTTFDAMPCDSGETICGCDGTQLPIEALSWLGDGSLDDGSFFWQQNPNLPVDFNCAMWGFDCNDEMEEGFFGYDPYGVCSGNLPPANGCIPETCNMVSLDVLTDCYPEEVSLAVYNANDDLVIEIPEGTFTADYTFYELELCLPNGCYTYYIFDSASDGMSYDGCTQDGQFGVYDYVNSEYFFLFNGDVYTSQFSQEFCIGQEVSCNNLQMVISNEPCTSVQGAAITPHISFDFSFTGNCTVEQIFLSASGGAFEPIDVSANNWQSGDEGDLYNLLPNTSYIIYYTTSDGATSPLYAFTTGNCNNEITICDCSGTQHTIGATEWLGDGFADNGFYQWAGQPVNFNCAIWGFDCGDINGAPTTDPYNVCNGQLPPYNGCSSTTEVLGCTDPAALNYNPQATINNGSCIYNAQFGCTNPDACNYNQTATTDNGTCEFTSCAGCTNPNANNYDPTATIDDGSCDFTAISGCTNPDALNYNPIATVNDGSCIFSCLWPTVVYDSYCVQGNQSSFFIDIDLNALGNGAPYTITNSYNNQQQVMSLMGSVTMGPFPVGVQVVVQVTSNTLDCAPLSSAPLTENCANQVLGCTDPSAINYNPAANVDDGSCQYETSVDELKESSVVHLYPNPAKDQVSILNKGLESVFQIIILDNMGKQVSTQQAIIQTGSAHQMDVSHLAQGHYHVQIVSNGTVEHRSLIIQK